MSIFKKAVDLGASIARPIDAIRNFADEVSTTDEERLQAQAVITRMELRQDELQVELNKVEAQSGSFYKGGWRPAIGWVGAISLALYFIPQYVIGAWMWTAHWISTGEIIPYPISPEGLLELILGMLGIGAFRMADKLAGREK